MPDPTSAPDRERTHAGDDDHVRPGDDAWDDAGLDSGSDDEDGLPSRSRRRRLGTPLTLALLGLLLATAGFIAGVQVQKGQQSGGGSAAAAGGAAAGGRAGFTRASAAGGGAAASGGGAAGAAAGGAQDQPTFGTVANKKGSTLYVSNADGTTVRVKTNAQSKVTRNATASARGIYPGDTVVIQGTTDKNGVVTATQITATSKSAATSGGGGFGGGGFRRGGFGAGGGAAPGGAAPGGGGTAGASGASGGG